MKVMNGLNLQNQKIQSLADPSAATDAATKQYVDTVAAGRDWKESARVASTANITLSAPGSVINGVTMVAGDRVLLKNQTTGSENGPWVWNGAAVAMTRPADAASGSVLTPGATIAVTEGTVDPDTRWTLTTDGAITVGTTAQVWSKDAGGGQTYTAGNGLQLVGSEFSVKLDTNSGLVAGSTGLKVDTSVLTRKYAAAIGNGSLTSIAVTHNLGTRDVDVTVYDTTTFEEVWVDNVRTDANTVTLIFATAPTTGQYRVVVNG